MPLHEPGEPFRAGAGMQRLAVPGSEEAVALMPALAQLQPLRVLPGAISSQHVEHRVRQLDCPIRRQRLRLLRVDALTRQILRRAADRQDLLLEVDVAPFETAQLASPDSAVEEQLDHHLVLELLLLEAFKKPCSLLLVEELRLCPWHLRRLHPLRRVRRNHLPHHGGVQDGRDQPVVMRDRLVRKRRRSFLDEERLASRHLHRLRHLLRGLR